MNDQFEITCPYCGESVSVYVEPDLHGTMVHDCEVCCRPWQLRVYWEDGERYVEATRGDGSE